MDRKKELMGALLGLINAGIFLMIKPHLQSLMENYFSGKISRGESISTLELILIPIGATVVVFFL